MENKGKQTCSNCPWCKSAENELLHKGVRDNADIDVLGCKKCGLVFLSDTSHIDDSFYEDSKMLGPKTDLKSWLENTAMDDQRRFESLKNKIKNKTLVDFGCGNAGFLNLAKSVCKKVFGIELQKEFCDYFKECNLDVHSDISALDEIQVKADFITMFHVLEHLKDPVQTLKNLESILSEEGKIIIEVPNADDALLSLYKSLEFADFTYWSCHLYLYNEKTLKQIIEKAGYKIISENKLHHIQRYNLLNHLYWLVKKKPGGHTKWQKYSHNAVFTIINSIYTWFLKSIKKTDTIIVEISKK